MRFSKTSWMAAVTLVAVAVLSQTAVAQREEGRRGREGGGRFGGPPTGAALLTLKEVQAELKLTDEQKEKVEKINEQMRQDMRDAFGGGGGREKMQEIVKSTTQKVDEVLDDGQRKRLTGIMIQVNGASAVADPNVAKELNITDDQKSKLEKIRDEAREGMRELFSPDLSREEREKKMTEYRDDINKKVLAVLSSDQQAQLESMKGEKVEVDLSQLRRGGPGGPGGGGDRPRGRGERGEGGRNRGSESKSEEKSEN
jgi:Spy/CpxP family protein refolding chaperone